MRATVHTVCGGRKSNILWTEVVQGKIHLFSMETSACCFLLETPIFEKSIHRMITLLARPILLDMMLQDFPLPSDVGPLLELWLLPISIVPTQDSWPLALSMFSSFSFGMRVYMCIQMYIAYTYLCICLCMWVYMFMGLFMCYGIMVERGGGRRDSVI